MTTLTDIGAILQGAIRTYETHRKLYSGHFTTSAAVDDNGTHLHLRAPRPGTALGSTFHGIAVPGPEGVRITETSACPLCHDKPAPTRGHVVRYGQIGAVR